MIRRFCRATGALLRDLYHQLRLCPECRAGARYLPFTRVHLPPRNVRLAIGELPRRQKGGAA